MRLPAEPPLLRGKATFVKTQWLKIPPEDRYIRLSDHTENMIQACSSRSRGARVNIHANESFINILYYGGKSCLSMVHNIQFQTIIKGISSFNLFSNHVCKYVLSQLVKYLQKKKT